MPAALFGITNDALNLVVNLLILFLVVLWLALVAWTYFDARRRLEDSFLVLCATACSLIFPFVGTIVYSILRPPEFLADRRERELEIRASELRVRQLEEASCPNCEHPVERSFLRCPNCRARIKDPCESCGKPIDPRWSICPYCETPVRRAAPPERRAAPSAAAEAAGRGGAARRSRRASRVAPQRRSTRAPRRAAADGESRRARQARAEPRRGPLLVAPTHAVARRPRRARRSERESDGRGVPATLILIKPDAFERGLTGEVLARFERKGLRITELRLLAGERGDRPPPLRGAHREAVLRRAGLVHHRRPAGRRGARGPRGGRGRPPADRRDEPDRGRARARSAATSGSRSPSTSSTAPTPTSRPSARSGSGSARAPDPRLGVAAPPRDPRAARGRVRGGGARGRGARDGRPRAVVLENARRKAAGRAAPGRRRAGAGARRRHRRRPRRPAARQARRRGGGARPARGALRAHPRGAERGRALDGSRGRVGARSGSLAPRSPSATSTRRRSTSTCASGEWRDRAGGLRDPGPRLDSGRRDCRATSPTSSACRSRCCCNWRQTSWNSRENPKAKV